MAASQHNAVVSALNTALIIGLTISLLVAAVAAVVMARRVLRPIDDLRAAPGRLAAVSDETLRLRRLATDLAAVSRAEEGRS